MTQTVTPRQDNTTLSSMENDLLYEIVDGHIVEKGPLGAYEILVGSFSIPAWTALPVPTTAAERSVKCCSTSALGYRNGVLMGPMCPTTAGRGNGVCRARKPGRSFPSWWSK